MENKAEKMIEEPLEANPAAKWFGQDLIREKILEQLQPKDVVHLESVSTYFRNILLHPLVDSSFWKKHYLKEYGNTDLDPNRNYRAQYHEKKFMAREWLNFALMNPIPRLPTQPNPVPFNPMNPFQPNPINPLQPLRPDTNNPLQPLRPDPNNPLQPLRPDPNNPLQPLRPDPNNPFWHPNPIHPAQPLRPDPNNPFWVINPIHPIQPFHPDPDVNPFAPPRK